MNQNYDSISSVKLDCIQFHISRSNIIDAVLSSEFEYISEEFNDNNNNNYTPYLDASRILYL